MNQREIKFRAWGKSEKTMGEVVSISFNDNGEYYIDVWYEGMKTNEAMKSMEIDTEVWIDGDFILMQYINLKDKNNKEIYENDIVKVRNPKQNHYRVLLIEQGHQTGAWPVMRIDKEFIEVIGNIYKNPELLK